MVPAPLKLAEIATEPPGTVDAGAAEKLKIAEGGTTSTCTLALADTPRTFSNVSTYVVVASGLTTMLELPMTSMPGGSSRATEYWPETDQRNVVLAPMLMASGVAVRL